MQVNINTVSDDIHKVMLNGIKSTRGEVTRDENGNVQIQYIGPKVTYYYTMTDDYGYIGRSGTGDYIRIHPNQDLDYIVDDKTPFGDKIHEAFYKFFVRFGNVTFN